MIESARDPEEAWRIMESYFDRETRMLDLSVEEILGELLMTPRHWPTTVGSYWLSAMPCSWGDCPTS